MPMKELSKAARSVVDLLVRGRRNEDLAFALGLREGTVKCHLVRVRRKMRARNCVEVARLALVERTARAIEGIGELRQ